MLVTNGVLNPKPSGRNPSCVLPRVTLSPRVPGSMTYDAELSTSSATKNAIEATMRREAV